MRPIGYALLWISESALFMALLTLIFNLFPEVAAYEFISRYTGVIGGDTWDNNYFLALAIVAFLLTAVMIFITASLIARQRRK